MSHKLFAIAAAAGTLLASTHASAAEFYTGGNCPTVSCAGTTFGSLTLPVNITFTDTSPTSSPDDWTFTIPAAQTTATGSGVELGALGLTGTITSFELLSQGSSTPIATGTSYYGGFLYLIPPQTLAAGNYEIQVSAVGTYTGTLSAVPLPASAWLLVSGLAGFTVLARRRRDASALS